MGAMRLRTVSASDHGSLTQSALARFVRRGIVLSAAILMTLSPPLSGQSATLETVVIAIQQSIQSGNQAGALEQIAAALVQFPRAAGLYNLRGVIQAQKQELPQARNDFQQAVRLAPALTPAWQNLARACQLTPGQDAAAVACAVEAWQHVLRARPADVEARASLATVLEWQGNFADSLRQLDGLPPEEAARSSTMALRCADLAGLGRSGEALEIAKKLIRAPDFSEADAGAIFPVLATAQNAPIVILLVETLQSAGSRDSVSLASLRHLSAAYEQASRLSDARQTLERIAAQEPGKPEDLFALARVAYGLRDLEGSLGYLAHIRDLTPNDARVHLLFGLIAKELELPIEARKSLEKALSLDAKNPDFNYALGSVILSIGDGATASNYLKIFVAARPAEARGHFALGVAYFSANDYDQCRAEMQIARNDPGNEAGAEFFLGRIARIEEKLDEAAAHLERTIRLSPSFAEGFAELARVRLRQERLDDAKAAVERAIALDPESFQANAALVVLYQKTHDPRLVEQGARLRTLDAARSKRQELMLRTIEVRPY